METSSQEEFEWDTTAEVHWLAAFRPRLARIDTIKNYQHLQAAMQRETDAIQKALCNLRVHYNALSPTGRFPPEILCRVFSFSAVDEPPNPALEDWEGTSTSDPALGWIKVTHVCHSWREAALQEPNLWTDVTGSLGREWGRLMLARSKTVPVSMSISGRSDLAETLPQILSRLSHLDQVIHDDSLSRGVAYWDVSAPLLESLALSAGDSLITLPAQAFRGRAPLLRRVDLHNVYLPYDSPLFVELTHLELSCSDCYQDIYISARPDAARSSFQIEHLLGSLARMPALRTLTLDNCIPSPVHNLSPTRRSTSTPSVVLPYLEMLKLVGTDAQCAGVLDCLDFPQACGLYLNLFAHWNQQNEEARGDVLPALRAHFFGETAIASRERAPISILHIPHIAHIKAWRCDVPKHSHSPIPTVSPFVEIVQGRNNRYADAWFSFEDICSIFPLHDLRVLHKDIDWCWNWPERYEWLAILDSCNALEDILVAGNDILRFSVPFFNLAPVMESGTVERPQDLQEAPRRDQIFLPNLRSLSLYQPNFSLDSQFHHTLAKWLCIRRALVPLPQLRIVRSGLTRSQVKTLRKVVKLDISRASLHEARESEDEDTQDETSSDEGTDEEGEA